jgi:hypothetical protein
VARILLGTPAVRANLDLVDVGGTHGFRGLRRGYHHLWVQAGDDRFQGEIVVPDDDAVITLGPRLSIDPRPETWARRDQAAAGDLDHQLQPPARSAFDWHTATWTIDRPVFQIPLGQGVPLRQETLRQLQAAFVRKVARHDEPAGKRFLELVEGVASATLPEVGAVTELYLDLAESLTAMIALAPALFGAEQAWAADWLARFCGLIERAGRQLHESLIPAAAALEEVWNGGRR